MLRAPQNRRKVCSAVSRQASLFLLKRDHSCTKGAIRFNRRLGLVGYPDICHHFSSKPHKDKENIMDTMTAEKTSTNIITVKDGTTIY